MIDETVIDTRKKDKNVVIISEERYGEMEKAERNSTYLRKLDRGPYSGSCRAWRREVYGRVGGNGADVLTM